MMERLVRRVEDIARKQQRETVARAAEQVKAILGSASIAVEEGRILVRGRGIIKRWLIDPSLRFLGGGFK